MGSNADDMSTIIHNAEADAERLLGIVRMAIALVLTAVLLLTTRNRPESAFLDQRLVMASFVIASYFTVGLMTYVVVRAGRFKPWMAWVTAALDVLLIVGNVWLSVQYSGLSSLYALTFPSAMMIPLILTFGALRFRPKIQIASTVLVGALIAAIVFSNPHIFANDQELLSQFNLRFGAPPNLVRIAIIVSTGGVIALAVWRARRLLDRVARETEQRLNLTQFLPASIAEDMSDEVLDRLRAGRKATLAIMFVDIRGFTQMTERMSPEAASRLLSDYRSNILDIVEQHGGMVDKFIGDGALILFGLQESPDEAARHAIDAATGLNERIAKWNERRATRSKPPIVIGTGLHIGSVVIGAIGDERRLEFTVIGDEVNVAARVEQLTKTIDFQLLATNDIFRKASGSMREGWHNVGSTPVRGREASVELWGYSR